MPPEPLIALARDTAGKHELYPHVVCGLIERESSWDPWKIRYEEGFYTRYIEKLIAQHQLSDPTEERARAFSWGLGQIMGEEARERGYKGHLAMLCDPPVGIEWTCIVLSRKLETASGNVPGGLQLYNGGGNPNYGAEVLALAEKYNA
jgi:soluble lytic murein transglycosylase-like protein